VHQTLYEQNALELVDLKSYLSSLINSEREVFGAKDRGIKIGVEAEGGLQLDMAVSVGLIVSEAVGNSFKYAFEGRQDGDISIEARVKNGHCHLAVTDNGIGFPASVKDGTGMMIIKTIARQRNATFHRLEGPGAGITVDFDVAPQASSTP
jgi:two-component sensor histidine kinase